MQSQKILSVDLPFGKVMFKPFIFFLYHLGFCLAQWFVCFDQSEKLSSARCTGGGESIRDVTFFLPG